MKQHRFFVEENIAKGGEITLLSKDVIHQIKDVLRLRKGDQVILLDNSGTELHGELDLVSKSEVKVREISIKKSSNLASAKTGTSQIKMKLYFSMIKKDKAEWVLQKCTELGVSEFHPVISERTEKAKLNMERANKIVREAAEQCERSDLPQLYEPINLEEAIDQCETHKVALHIKGEKINVSQLKKQETFAIFVGPEGGWGEKDMDIFKRHNVPLVSVGANVLRSETASVAVSSVVLL